MNEKESKMKNGSVEVVAEKVLNLDLDAPKEVFDAGGLDPSTIKLWSKGKVVYTIVLKPQGHVRALLAPVVRKVKRAPVEKKPVAKATVATVTKPTPVASKPAVTVTKPVVRINRPATVSA